MFTTRNSRARTRAAAATTLVGLILLGGGAGLASANTAQDTTFLAGLDKQGITYTYPQAPIIVANHLCGEFDRGSTKDELVAWMLEPGKLSAYSAEYFVDSSVSNYCPDHTNKLS